MKESINRNEFLRNYKFLKSKIYTVPNENARDELFDFLNRTKNLYIESRINAVQYLDDVDEKVDICFDDIAKLILEYPSKSKK